MLFLTISCVQCKLIVIFVTESSLNIHAVVCYLVFPAYVLALGMFFVRNVESFSGTINMKSSIHEFIMNSTFTFVCIKWPASVNIHNSR